jgi:hypothetical protein
MEGNGIRSGLRPSVKKLLEQVGDEKITSLTVWREVLPYSRFVKTIRPDIPYDKLFHLSLNINGKYNLDKDGVAISFKRGSPKGEKMTVSPPSDMTIKDLFDKTRKRMGESNFLNYEVDTLNCQHFIDNILSAIGSNTNELKKFVNQDVKKVIDKLGGKWATAFVNALKSVQEVVDIVQEGGSCGSCGYDVMKNNGLPMCKIKT